MRRWCTRPQVSAGARDLRQVEAGDYRRQVEYGAHLPLADLDGRGWSASALASYARTAQQLGFRTLTADDHLVFSRPWLDGIVALASVIEASSNLDLATTMSSAVRGPAALSKAAAAIDVLSGGRLVLGTEDSARTTPSRAWTSSSGGGSTMPSARCGPAWAAIPGRRRSNPGRSDRAARPYGSPVGARLRG